MNERHDQNKTKFEVEFTFKPQSGTYPGFQPHFHLSMLDDRKLDKIICQQEIIMGQLEDANAAISKINDATNRQASALDTLSTVTQEISDDVDALIAGGNVPASMVADLQAKADRLDAVSTALDAHVEFSKAIASKSPAQPVPIPVPDPLPPA